jgi:3-deoxy-D-manno-octulosonic-acid transferase
MIAATVPPGAGRARWPARAVLRPAWSALSVVCACSDEDATRLTALGVRGSALNVTGDPGVDAAAERASRAAREAPALAPFHADRRPTVVAGSTWPSDEAVLLPALAEVRRALPDLRVILVPHEPTSPRVRDLMARLTARGWRVGTLASLEANGSAEGTDAVVVERVGVLAQLYIVGDVAYVGGGFGRRGLHSVLEPAAAGVPVVFGPRHRRAPAADALVAAGAAGVAADRTELALALTAWLTDQEARAQASGQARGYIQGHRGAADRTAALLDPLFLSPKTEWPKQ